MSTCIRIISPHNYIPSSSPPRTHRPRLQLRRPACFHRPRNFYPHGLSTISTTPPFPFPRHRLYNLFHRAPLPPHRSRRPLLLNQRNNHPRKK